MYMYIGMFCVCGGECGSCVVRLLSQWLSILVVYHPHTCAQYIHMMFDIHLVHAPQIRTYTSSMSFQYSGVCQPLH